MRLTKIQKEIMLANHTEMCEKLDRQEEAKTKKAEIKLKFSYKI